MKLDNFAINSFFKNHQLIITIVGLFLLLLLIGGIFGYCQRQNFLDEIEKEKTNANKLINEAVNENSNYQNLRIDNGVQSERVNQARNSYENSKNETNKLRENTNRALDNINSINNRDFNNLRPGTSKRCEAVPESPDCK